MRFLRHCGKRFIADGLLTLLGVTMRRLVIALAVTLLALPAAASAQGSTCADGTTSRASGRGACSHHGGVAKTTRPKPAPTPTSGRSGDIVLPQSPSQNTGARESAPMPAATAARASARGQQAGATKVWVNSKSGVYHCPGSRWYGATKNGTYMTEREAKVNGDRPAYGRACSS